MTCLALLTARVNPLRYVRPFSSLRTISSAIVRPSISSFLSVGSLYSKRRGPISFSSKAPIVEADSPVKSDEKKEGKRKTRSVAAKNSLRRVAVEAQRSRSGSDMRKLATSAQQTVPKTVTAVCAAQEYDITKVVQSFKSLGHTLDPYRTELHEQVVHVTIPVQTNSQSEEEAIWSTGDLFVFPSGTVVAWAIPDSVLSLIVSKSLLSAAQQPLHQFEKEDLEFVEDSNRESSSIKGDRIILGTKPQKSQLADSTGNLESIAPDNEDMQVSLRNLDTVLAKIAFSSGLARSTKLAVLESLLEDYFDSTKSIPAELSRGGRLPFSRKFISQKTGQLLGIRAQLNLYSELTDSLPDLFWDSRHELGLEGYYDQVGRALDTNIRIKVLNEKMDYAQEIASVLRQHLSEVHGVHLEWIIIALIAVEVFFAIRNELKDYLGRQKAEDGHSL